MAISEPFKFATKFIEALGLPDDTAVIDLHIDSDGPVMITIKYYPQDTNLDKLIPILKKYELKEKKAELEKNKSEAL